MRVLLLSTYDLGRQPFGLASPAAWLKRAGIDVAAVDLSRDKLSDDAIADATLVAFYLPMHTATRLALPVIDRIRTINPAATLCAYGLYAPLNEALLRERGVSVVLGPEAEADLVSLASAPLTGTLGTPALGTFGTPGTLGTFALHPARSGPCCPGWNDTRVCRCQTDRPRSPARPMRRAAASIAAVTVRSFRSTTASFGSCPLMS